VRLTYINHHSGASTNQADIFGGAVTNAVAYITESMAPVDGDIENFAVFLTVAPGLGNTRTFGIVVNGSTVGTLTISDLATSGSIPGPYAVSAGDLVVCDLGSTGTPSASDWSSTFEVVATVDGEHGYSGNIGLHALTTRYISPFHPGTQAPGTVPAQSTVAVAAPVTMTAILIGTQLSSLGVSQSFIATVYLSTDDGATFVAQDGSGGTVDTRTTIINVPDGTVIEQTFSLPLVRGDLIYIELVGNTATSEQLSLGTRFTTANGVANLSIGTNPNSTSASVENFDFFRKPESFNWNTSSTGYRQYGSVSGFTLGMPYLYSSLAPSPGTRTIALRINGVTTAVSATLSGAAVPSVADGTGSQAFVYGDVLCISHLPTGTPTVTSTPRWTFAYSEGAFPVLPVAVDDTYSVIYPATISEPAVSGVLANDTLGNGADPIAVLDDDVSDGTLVLSADGSFTYDPEGYIGVVTFTYHINTSHGDSNIATVTITITRETPIGGGNPGAGENPEPGEVPTGIIRVFFEMHVGNTEPYTVVAAGETMMRDPGTWYGGKKLPRIISISEITRELTDDGSFRGAEVRVVVADTDRVFRQLAQSDTISGSYLAIYLVSDTVRYALGEPFRLFAGLVHNHSALPGFRYELVVRDVLSDRIADLDASPRIPPDRLSVVDFPGMDPQYEGRAVPLVVGFNSDEAETGTIAQDPQGVIPPTILGRINFTHWGGINQEVIACIWSSGALVANGLWTIYYNPLETPDVRIPIPLSSFGVDVWTPGLPGWSDTGLSDDFADYPMPLGATTRRYTPFFVRADQPLAQAFIEGRVLVAANLYGGAENADGTGQYLSDAPRVWQWLIVNQLFSPYKTGDYADMPMLDELYSIIDTDTVDTATERLRGFLGVGDEDYYPIGFLLGRDGTQQTLRHILGELCHGVLMEQGINRHGQLIVDVEDVDAEATVDLSDLHDIENGEFTVWIDHAAYRNRIEYVYGRRYVAPSAPPATPPEGEPVPSRTLPPYHEWTSGLRVITNDPAIVVFGNRHRTLFMENYVVRDSAVAENVAARMLQRLSGPTPSFDGPRMFRLTTSWQGLAAELGTVIGITHLEGLGLSGYEGKRGRVTKISVDPQRARVTLEGRLLDDLPEALPEGPETEPVDPEGGEPAFGTAEQTIDPVTQVASDQEVLTGTAAQTLSAVTQSATGLVDDEEELPEPGDPISPFALELIYPKAIAAAPSGLDANNRCYFAYPGIPYQIRVCAIGGAWPYTYSLSNEPSGMTVDQDTGLLTWTNPTVTASNVQVTVTDDEGTTVSSTWSIAVGTSGWFFVDAASGNDANAGTLAAPWQSILKVYNSSGAYGRVYFRAGTYLFTGVPITSGGTAVDNRYAFSGPSRSTCWIGYPGDTRPVINFASNGSSTPGLRPSGHAIYYRGLTFQNGFNKTIWVDRSGRRGAHFDDCIWDTLGPAGTAGAGDNSAGIMYTQLYGSGGVPDTQAYGDVVTHCTFDDFQYTGGETTTPVGIKLYSWLKGLVHGNHFGANISREVVALKSDTSQITVRGNTFTDSTIGGNFNRTQDESSVEICFNLFQHTGNGLHLWPSKGTFDAGAVYVYRNTIAARILIEHLYTIDGPYTFQRNVIVNADGAGSPYPFMQDSTISDASRVTTNIPSNPSLAPTGVENLAGTTANAIIDSNGLLIGAYRTAYLGLMGHEQP
jgi:hypothetical protein